MTHPTPSETPVPRPGVRLRLAGMTDVGITRDHNEDAFAFLDLSSGQTHTDVTDGVIETGLRGVVLVVADGMGGAAAGEIASEMAVEAVLDTFRAQWMNAATRGRHGQPSHLRLCRCAPGTCRDGHHGDDRGTAR
jgi:serine/threonine protein phosphatase PrpC